MALSVSVMRNGSQSRVNGQIREGEKFARPERFDTEESARKLPSRLTGYAYAQRNRPTLGKVHIVLSKQGRMVPVRTVYTVGDGSFEITFTDQERALFAGLLFDLPAHGITFLTRAACCRPGLDVRLAFVPIDWKLTTNTRLNLLVDGVFPIDVMPLIRQWSPGQISTFGISPMDTLVYQSDVKAPVQRISQTQNPVMENQQPMQLTGQVTSTARHHLQTKVGYWLVKPVSRPPDGVTQTDSNGNFVISYFGKNTLAAVGVIDPVKGLASKLQTVITASNVATLIPENAGEVEVAINDPQTGEPLPQVLVNFERVENTVNTATSKLGTRFCFTTTPVGTFHAVLPAGEYALTADSSSPSSLGVRLNLKRSVTITAKQKLKLSIRLRGDSRTGRLKTPE